jgi:hypothetical protein
MLLRAKPFPVSFSFLVNSTHIYLPMKMKQCSETSAYKLQTPGNYPKESIQQTVTSLFTKARNMKFRFYGHYNTLHNPRLHHQTNPNSIVRNVHLKISSPLSFKPVEETLDSRTVLTCLLFLYNIFLLKKFSHVHRVAKSRY